MSCCIRKGLLTCVAVVLALSAATQAGAKMTYTCTLTPTQSKTWIPKVLFIGHDETQDRVVVSDPMVLYFNDRIPVEGRVSAETPQRITFVWDYFAKDSRGQRAKMQFHATWVKSTQRMKVTATPAGYSKRFTGAGTCELATL
jgi:hypothetical protein